MSDKKIRAIIVGPAFALRGGIANFNEALARAMNAEGYDTEIVSFSLQYPSFLFPGTTQYDTGSGPGDLRISTMINSVNPLSWFSTARYIRKQKPALVIVRYWLPFMGPALGTIVRQIKKDPSVKVIAITDNVIPHEHRPGDSAFTRYFLKKCDGFIAMSRSVLRDLEKFVSTDKKIYQPHPIYDIFGQAIPREKALEMLGLPADQRYILFFGFIRKYKGLDLLLTAMADDRVKKLGLKLVIAGEFYEDRAPYEKLISDLYIADNVIQRTSYIPATEVGAYFCASDLVAQPYRTATQSGVTQIAYHFEKPMLVTDVGGLPEIVPNGVCGYVTEVDPRSIAEAIDDFFSNQRYEAFSANVRKEKDRFLWPSFVKGIRDLSSRL